MYFAKKYILKLTTKEEFDKAPVVGHIIEGIGLVFTDRGGHEVNA